MSGPRSEVHRIDSAHNKRFRELLDLHHGKSIRKQSRALLAGEKIVAEALRRHPARCRAWVTARDREPPPEDAPPGLVWVQIETALFRELDLFGTHRPLLVVDAPELPAWSQDEELPAGATLLLPFQNPENVGAAVRSGVAFGASAIVLLAESAHPLHPRSVRASAGAVLGAPLRRGPALADLRPAEGIVALSTAGRDLRGFAFPERFALLAGLEGPGLPQAWRSHAVAVPIAKEVESLNAAAAVAVGLYAWRSGG